MTRVVRLSAFAVAGALALAGCGSSGSSGTSKGTDTTVSGSGASSDTTFAAPASKKFDLAQPVKIVALISDVGKDPLAVPDFNDGARLAVDEINAAGGLGGHPIEYKAITTPPYGDITNSLNQALDEKPTVILGPVSSTTLDTISSKIDKAGIPVLHDATAQEAALGGPNGSQWIFALRPFNSALAATSAHYAAKDLKAKTAGILYLNAAFGIDSEQASTKAFEADGGTVKASEAFEATQTDFSKEVQKMKGVDVVFDWGTPASLAATTTAFAQQGLGDIPRLGAGSIAFSSFYSKVEDPKLLDNLGGVVDCNPVGDKRPAVQAWVKRYQAKYKYLPSYSSAQLYDGVYMLRQVIEAAEKDDPATIRDGLQKIDYTKGMCAEQYKDRNNDNVLFDEATAIKFVDGKPVTVKHYTNINGKG